MNENKVSPSPVERLQIDFTKALQELNDTKLRRDAAMKEWADLRASFQGTRPDAGLEHRFTRATQVMEELNTRYVEAQRRCRQIRNTALEGHAAWSREHFPRSSANTNTRSEGA